MEFFEWKLKLYNFKLKNKMKQKVLFITLFLILCSGILFCQQRKTYTEKIEDVKKYTQYSYVKYTGSHSFYYDKDDNKIEHGLLSVNGSENLSFSADNKNYKGTVSFNASANYVDGKINGILSEKLNYNINTANPKDNQYNNWNLSASFKNGTPDGTWKFNRSSNYGEAAWWEQKSRSITITFKDGNITSVSTNYGSNGSLNSEGKISGKFGDITIKDGFATVFKRKNGEYSALENEQKEIISKIKDSSISKLEIIDKGYFPTVNNVAFDISLLTTHLNDKRFCDINQFAPNFKLEDEGKRYDYIILEKVETATVEDCMEFCNKYHDGYDYMTKNLSIFKTKNKPLYVTSNVLKEINISFAPYLDSIYNSNIILINKHKNDNSEEALSAFQNAAKSFGYISLWKDSEEQSKYCKERADKLMAIIVDSIYKSNIDTMTKYSSINTEEAFIAYKNASDSFEKIKNYKDVNERIETCNNRMNEIAIIYINDKHNSALELIKDYSDKNTKESLQAYENGLEILKSIEQYKNVESDISKFNSRIYEIRKDIRLAENLQQFVVKELDAIVKETKYQIVGYVKFSPTSNIILDYDYSGYSLSSTQDRANILNEHIAPFCPMIEYKLVDIAKIRNSNKFLVECIIDKKVNTSGQYETYEISFEVTDNGKIIVKTLDFGNAKKITNEWDKIVDNENKILAKSKECKNIVSSYSKYKKTAETSTIENLKAIIANQEKILKAINSSNAVELDNKVKKLKDKSIESVIKEIQQ